MTVADIMETKVYTVSPDDPIEKVLDILRKHELPGVPVVDAERRCVGIITENDLVLAGEDEDLHLPHYVEIFGGLVFVEPVSHYDKRLKKALAMTAADMMTADPITVTPDQSVKTAAQLIAQRKHNRLPVVEDGRLVGIVTRLRVLEALTQE
jgi:CBS domain-containing protein